MSLSVALSLVTAKSGGQSEKYEAFLSKGLLLVALPQRVSRKYATSMAGQLITYKGCNHNTPASAVKGEASYEQLIKLSFVNTCQGQGLR